MKRLLLGTRGSPLALAQARLVAEEIRRREPVIEVGFEVIRTHGDEDSQADAEAFLSGKAVFTQRIEDALVGGRVQAAVHSFKDLPAESSPGLVVAAVPPREQPFDVLVSRQANSLEDLPGGGRVGTSSLRRAAQLRAARPDIQVMPLRGNVETRLRRMEDEGWDGIVIAYAGLRRLALDGPATHVLPPSLMLPAPAQGALAVQARSDDAPTLAILGRIESPEARVCVEAERAFAHELGGDCNVPVAALAQLDKGQVSLDGCIAEPRGLRVVRGSVHGDPADANAIARQLARQLRDKGGDEILEAIAR